MPRSYPLVSIIIATYNRGYCVGKAVDSALSQTYKNVEIIIIDDSSTDNTREVLQPYLEKGAIKCIFRKERGRVTARDVGIRASQGRYVAVLDSDDLWSSPDKLVKQINFLENHPDHVLVGGGLIKIDEKGKEISRSMPPENDEEIRKLMLFNNMFCHSSVIYRKSAWEKVAGYCGNSGAPPEFQEDWNLWLGLGTLGKLHNLQEYFVYYVEGTQNISQYYKRPNLKAALQLRQKYSSRYPNARKAIFLNWFYYFYSFFPFQRQLYPIFTKIRKTIFGY